MDAPAIHKRRWWILGTLVLSLIIVVLDTSILNVALKTIQAELGASQSQLEWAIAAYILTFAGLLLMWGILGDRMGRRRILILGFVLFGLASLASAYATSPAQLIAARAFLGVGGAAVMPTTLSIISAVFDPAERPKAIGIWAASVGFGVAVGPITGGALLERFWWGSVFLINVPIVLLGLVAIMTIVPESRDPNPGRLDPVGVLLSMAGLVLVIFGIIAGGQHADWLRPVVWTTMLLGVALLAIFVWYESRSDHPAIDVRLFRDPRLRSAVLSIGTAFFALIGGLFITSFYVQIVRGYSPLEAGLLFLPMAVAQTLSAFGSAALVTRYGARTVSVTGLLLISATFIGFLGLGVDTPIWYLETLFFVQGAGTALVIPPATEVIMAALPREKAGAGAALGNVMRHVGGGLGVAVLGSVLSTHYRTAMDPWLAALADPVRAVAGESIGGTFAVAGLFDDNTAAALRERSLEAFVDAMHLAALGAALITLFGLFAVLRWMPPSTAATLASGRADPKPGGDPLTANAKNANQ